jgi:hypothetical protein
MRSTTSSLAGSHTEACTVLLLLLLQLQLLLLLLLLLLLFSPADALHPVPACVRCSVRCTVRCNAVLRLLGAVSKCTLLLLLR